MDVSQIQSQINMYNILSYICLTLMVIFILTSVMFFFLFRIKSILAYMFGFSEKETTKRIQQKNAITGNLRSGQINMDFTTNDLSKYGDAGNVAANAQGSEETTELSPKKAEIQLPQPVSGAAQTPVQPIMAPLSPVLPAGFHFTITENIMVIHTNELI